MEEGVPRKLHPRRPEGEGDYFIRFEAVMSTDCSEVLLGVSCTSMKMGVHFQVADDTRRLHCRIYSVIQ
jgi:hypothetical protein